MAHRSQLDRRFDRECAWAALPSCSLYLLVSGRIQPALDIRLQKLPRAKKLTVLHSIFSYCWSFSTRLYAGFCLESQVKLCGSVLEILRRRLRTRQAESLR